MFTGITENIGIIKSISKRPIEYNIETSMPLADVKIGSSIMCSSLFDSNKKK